MELKLCLGFNDPNILSKTPFHAKAGRNAESAAPYSYAAFLYARMRDRATLEEYAKPFPYAELIIGLDRNGGALPSAQRIMLKK
jgi:hypothetical protein